MNCAQGDVDRLVFRHELHLVVNRHLGGPAHHDPVFGAMVVALQRQRRAWMDVDAFHLETVADNEAFEPAPRAVILGEGRRLRRALGLERIDRLFNVLRPRHIRNQHGIVHRNRHDVLEPDAHDLQTVAIGSQ